MRVIFLFLLLLVFAGCQSTPNPTFVPTPEKSKPIVWNEINFNLPTHTPVAVLAADPTRPATIYAGTYDTVGVYKSDDLGETWHSDNKDLPQVPVFALLPTQDELYAGTADGLYRRAWNADFWQRAAPVPQVAIYGLAPGGEASLYAATDGRGVWRTDDAGRSWTRLPGLDDEPLLSVLPLDDSNIMAGTAGHGMFMTQDGGSRWDALEPFEGEYVTFIVRDNDNTIYARARNGLYRSLDSGANWSKLGGGIETEIVNSLLFVNDRIFASAAGGGIYSSDDKGDTWTKASVENPRRRAILSLLRIDNTLFAGTFDGLVVSRDGGESWAVFGHGLGTPLVHDIALSNPSGAIIAATEDGVYLLGEEGYTRFSIGTDDVPALSVAIAPSAPQRIYVGTDGRGVFVSDDVGSRWGGAGGDLGGRARVPQVSVDPNEPETVFACVLFERIYKSETGGDEWMTVWTGVPIEEQLQSMMIAPGDSSIMYAGGDTQFFFSDNSGESWQARGLRGISTLAIWVDPQNASRVWAGTTDGLYTSLDSGRSWRGPFLTGTTIRSIVRDRAGIFYLATRGQGVLASRDAGETFIESGLESTSVNQLLVDLELNKVYARTTHGIFEMQSQ